MERYTIRELIQEFFDNTSPQSNTDIDIWLKGRDEELDDLTKRLQDDYSGEKDFKQYEEDRLTTYDICDFLEFLREKAIKELEEDLS